MIEGDPNAWAIIGVLCFFIVVWLLVFVRASR